MLAAKISENAEKKVQFPPLRGVVGQEPKVEPKMGRSVVPNRDRSNGASLEFIDPLERYGIILTKFDYAEVAEVVKRWKRALIVYVLGAKPPFNVMKQFFEKRWGGFGEFKLFLLYVDEFRDVKARTEVMETMVL